MRFDPAVVPFSRRGSWLSLSCPQGSRWQPLGQGLYLRANHCRGVIPRELFKLTLRRGDQEVPHRLEAEPQVLRMRAADGRGGVELLLEGDTLRARGEGVGLRFDCALASSRDRTMAKMVAAHAEGGDRWTVNCRPALRRVQFVRLRGSFGADAPWTGEAVEHARIDAGRDGHPWEVAADSYQSTWVARERKPFATAMADAAGEFRDFRAALPALPARWRKAGELAAYVLWSCTKRPQGMLGREAVLMSLNWMDQVWSWDNWFNAAALATGHARLALDQLLLMADHQDEHGAYPDALNDGFRHYCFSKPPVQGVLLRWMRERSPGFLAPAAQRALYPTLSRFTQWWLDHRRAPGERLCHYLHGNDSGWDNTTLLREGAPLIAPDLNAFLVVQAQELAHLADGLGRRKDALRWRRVALELEAALVEELWLDGSFVGRLAAGGRRPVGGQSLVACMPLVLGRSLPASLRTSLVGQVRALTTQHGLATEHPQSPYYEEDGYWRGPTWAPSTMLAAIGLEACGEAKLARDVARRFLTTCARVGFPENYGSLSGEPLRDRAYTWTASAFLELARAYG